MNKNLLDILMSEEEPYLVLEDGRRLASWDVQKGILYNQQQRQYEKLLFYRKAFDFLYAFDLQGDYLEFGCHKARTFRMALTEARKKNFTRMRFYAFDSFEGLPNQGNNQQQNTTYLPGVLTTTENDFMAIVKRHGLFQEQIFTVKGFYEESLTKKCKAELKKNSVQAAFITLDCSLYESFVSAFNFIEDFIQDGTIIYIDDWRVGYKGNPKKGIPQAFFNFQKKSAFCFDPFANIGWFGKAFLAYAKEKE